MADPTRLDMEIELLQAMYPDQVHYNEKSRELKYTDNGAILLLRLPETYPEDGHPDIISATNPSKADIRTAARAAIAQLNLPQGGECLDVIIAEFQVLIQQEHEKPTTTSDTHGNASNDTTSIQPPNPTPPKTIIIWLHHLLNTNKRKLCLSPPLPSSPTLQAVSGMTKPGYPGVLIYSGPATLVTQHVNTLKAQNWAAFQVRFEEDVRWEFGHGEGVKECESMSEIVKGVEGGARGEMGRERKEEFLRAVGIK